MKKRCSICGYGYDLIPVPEDKPYFLDSSHCRITLRKGTKTAFFDYDICPRCADKLVYHIYKLQSDAPRKCFWCEFDLGPKSPNYPHPTCECCFNYNNFKLKERLSPHARLEWEAYKIEGE